MRGKGLGLSRGVPLDGVFWSRVIVLYFVCEEGDDARDYESCGMKDLGSSIVSSNNLTHRIYNSLPQLPQLKKESVSTERRMKNKQVFAESLPPPVTLPL